MRRKIWLTIATGLGSGYSPIAPGTAGSFVAMVLYLVLVNTANPLWIIPLIIILFPVSIHAATVGEKYYGRKDPGYVTIDEVIGYFISVVYLPPGLTTAVLGFFVFRFFDIVKPYPGRKCEAFPGGVGIVMDDVAAGVYANILIRVIYLVTAGILK
jgi:phosphatidylglycerophosphatase A